MGLLKRLLKGSSEEKSEFKAKLKQAQEDDRIVNLIEERKKSSNRRALEREIRDREEAQIKVALETINKQKNKEMWKTKNTILGEKTTILNNERPILKEKNIFTNNKNIFNKVHSMRNNTNMGFFK